MDNSKSASLVYDKIVDQYAKSFHEPSDYIDEFLKYVPAQWKILDIGCWTGVDSNYMASLWFQITGIDLSSGMIKFAKKKYPHINFHIWDARKLSSSENLFNWILVACVLIHIPKKYMQQILCDFNSSLEKNWVIYIALQEWTSDEIFIKEPFNPDEKLFLNIISYDEIHGLLQKAWFAILHTFHTLRKSRKTKGELNYPKLYVIAKKATKFTAG